MSQAEDSTLVAPEACELGESDSVPAPGAEEQGLVHPVLLRQP